MKKKMVVTLLLLMLKAATSVWGQAAKTDGGGRYSQRLDGRGWRMMRDTKAQWRDDRLYLPAEIGDLGQLPVNAPTDGWQVLSPTGGRAVSVPGTVEEYQTTSARPQPQDFEGVSWWWRTLTVPAAMRGQRVLLSFESVRQRAEVYLDGRLVAYDVVGETPFEADITEAVTFGQAQTLAVRVTNPGGNFHWQDYVPQHWGKYQILPGRSFGGIIGAVCLKCVPEVHISDVYVQNQPEPTRVNVLVETYNPTGRPCRRDVELTVAERGSAGRVIFTKKIKNVELAADTAVNAYPVSCPEAKLWDIGKPNLYTCTVRLIDKKRDADSEQRTFGFRWFEADGIGRDAVLRLNGRRVTLRSAIGWGYFPETGLAATDEMAERQVRTAQALGLNMLNFHRNIGRPNVLQKADSLGLLYYEEPGGYQTSGKDAFAHPLGVEKTRRMMRRDRSHPSLIIYNMINEYGGSNPANHDLVGTRMQDMRTVHAVDPSRILTFTSGWATSEQAEEDSKAHMMPFDTTLYRRGWFDNHRAGGPATYEEAYYKGPKDNYMYTGNRTEIFMRGEEGAISTPPRLQLIHDEMERTGRKGWDGPFWEDQYQAFKRFFDAKQLAPSFATLDSLCCAMGRVQVEHQGRRIQGMRMQNLGDIYVVNGWEQMPYDNHSGIVDNYRNPKCDPQVMARYCQPLYVAVCTRNQVVRTPGKAVVDCYIVNEVNVNGPHRLSLRLKHPDGHRSPIGQWPVSIAGGETYGQLLLEGIEVSGFSEAGMYTIEANLDDVATGSDEVLAVRWGSDELTKGRGALYGPADGDVTRFYQQTTGRELSLFTPTAERLDWLVVDRSSLDEPQLIPANCFRNLRLSWFSDNDIRIKVGEEAAADVNRSFAAGAQPCDQLPANQVFSATWEGDIIPQESGLHLIGIEASAGARLWINGEQVLDKYWNREHFQETRPVQMVAGRAVHVKVGYYQHGADGSIQLKWSRPGVIQISPQDVLDRARTDGTTVVVLGHAETWMEVIAKATGIRADGYYTVGKNWVGGIHFVKSHPLFEGLPTATAMNWPYQALVRDGDNRYGFHTEGEEMVVGSYRSWPFHLGTAVGIVSYGKGRIIFSSLDIASNLCSPEGPAEVARRVFLNMINYQPLQTSANERP